RYPQRHSGRMRATFEQLRGREEAAAAAAAAGGEEQEEEEEEEEAAAGPVGGSRATAGGPPRLHARRAAGGCPVQSMAVLFSRSPPEPQRRRAPAAPIWRGGARAPRNDGQSAASSAPVRLKYSNYSIPSEFSIELTTCG
ncbi:unnamed protein product, partial [Prorocentrum cordatum]